MAAVPTPGTEGLLDSTRPPRPGEQPDLGRLLPYLREQLGLPDGGPGGDPAGDVELTQFPGGHSNLTYLIRFPSAGPGGREVVLRRPPFGSKVKTAHDMGREHRILSRLSPVYPRAPRPLLYCEDESILGAKFYVMERIRGVVLRRELPRGLTVDEATARGLCEAAVDTLVELHGIDYGAIGLGDFGKPDGFVTRQVEGWTERYHGSKTDEIPEIIEVAAWLRANIPVSPAATLIHNDFKFDNLILDPGDLTQIVGILDWEMSTLGDPLMDLGTALCYWVEESDPAPLKAVRFGPTTLPGMYTRREFAARYAEKSGRDLSHAVFYYCFGLFKTAVVAQQIYYRYKKGLTEDARFGAFLAAVQIMARQAAAYLGKTEL